MKNFEEFKSLFPIKAKITQEIIDTAELYDNKNCIGAKALREVLPEKFKLKADWGADNTVILIEGYRVYLTTEERINLMKVTEPMDVTFILDKRYN